MLAGKFDRLWKRGGGTDTGNMAAQRLFGVLDAISASLGQIFPIECAMGTDFFSYSIIVFAFRSFFFYARFSFGTCMSFQGIYWH